MQNTERRTLSLSEIRSAKHRINEILSPTPLQHNLNYSEEYDCHIQFKREDLQIVRSYKIRGAYNKISSLTKSELDKGIVCASAGNHAQGVAYSCNLLQVKGKIYMPAPTPKQKIDQVKRFGKEYVEIIIGGDTFDDASKSAIDYATENEVTFIHPFDDYDIMSGQGTVGLEILEQSPKQLDYLFLPIGGGGLASGICSLFEIMSPETKIIGVEPLGAASMKTSITNGINTSLDSIEKFVDGAAVKRVGDKTFEICKDYLHDVITVDEGAVCTEILKLYNQEALVAEPAGALSVAALRQYKEEIKGKNVACVISGGNNDITRMEEIKERSLLFEKVKHYFIVKFPQRAGALKEFVVDVLGDNDDITHFEYTKKSSREKGSAVVGIELKSANDFYPLLERMKERNFYGEYINENDELFTHLI